MGKSEIIAESQSKTNGYEPSRISLFKQIIFPAFIFIAFFLILNGLCYIYLNIKPSSKPQINLPEKEKTEFRVFAYGGSTVFGYPNAKVGFVKQTEFWLNKYALGRKVKIFNFGVTAEDSSFACEKLALTIHNKPDAIILLSGHNEYLDIDCWYRGEEKKSIIREMREKIDILPLSKVMDYVLSKFYQKKLKPLKRDARRRKLLPIDRKSPLFKEIQNRYSENINKIYNMARLNKIPLFLCTLPANILDWPPVYKKISWQKKEGKAYDSNIAEISKLLDEGKVVEAKEKIEILLKQDKDDAMLVYLLGKVYFSTGDYKKAEKYLIRAKDLDPLPRRALNIFNEKVRELSGKKGVYLVDVERLFQKRSPGGIVGFNLIIDNCHPSPFGNSLVAREIIMRMLEEKVIDCKVPAKCCQTDAFLAHLGFSKRMKTDYLLNSAEYCIKEPYFYYSASMRYLKSAFKLDQSNWRLWANLATMSFFKNRVNQGVDELKRAMKLKKDHFNIGDVRKIPYLEQELKNVGISIDELIKSYYSIAKAGAHAKQN